MNSDTGRLIKGTIQLADPKIWMMSYIPFTLGLAISVLIGGARITGWDVLWILAAYAALGLIETGKNAINEYTDYISGVDTGVDEEHRTPFSGGKKTITSGLLNLRQVLWITVLSFMGAGAIGIVLVIFKEVWILPVGIAGILFSLLYSVPPVRLCYRGWGELLVGITFGPLVLSGAYVMMTGRIDVLPVLISVPLGLVIANILIINEYPDLEADKAGGKRNLVVRLGKRSASKVYGIIFIFIYMFYAAAALWDMNPVWLLPLVTVPMAYRAYTNSILHADEIRLLTKSNILTIQSFQLTGLLLLVATVLTYLFRAIL
ncbi:MAG: prenyltransferase [Saccharofermentanales bacterium]